MKAKKNSYNGGVVGVYKEKSTLMNTDFNAKTNAKTLEDFDLITSLCFSEQTKRQEDFLFAEAMGKKLTWKIKTPLVKGIENNYKIIYEGYSYDIINMDFDRKNKELYFYLEGGRKIAE